MYTMKADPPDAAYGEQQSSSFAPLSLSAILANLFAHASVSSKILSNFKRNFTPILDSMVSCLEFWT